MSRVETSPGVGAVVAGRYRLDARVGAGRTGIVFRAFDQALKTTVAVKILNSGPFSGADRTINVFRVNRVLAYRHDGLVRVQDVTLVPTAASRVFFLVEDWIDGRSFDAYIRGRNPLQNWEILEAFRQLSSALGFIHKIGVHGNLTPANVFVVDGRRLVLTDCYDILGTPPPTDKVAASFRAPELADTASGREDPASDIWSLGMLLGMALLRSPVHPGVRLSAQGPGVPYEADAVFLRATEPDPRRRFGSIDEMVDAMRMALPGEPAVVEAVGFVGRHRSEVSMSAQARTEAPSSDGRKPSALQVAPEEALDWVDESSPEIDWTDVETVAEWADEAGDWSAAEVLDDAAVDELEIEDSADEVEVDSIVPTKAAVVSQTPAQTSRTPVRTPTVPSRARSRSTPGFDSTRSAVVFSTQEEPLPEPSPLLEPMPEPDPVAELPLTAVPELAPEPDLALTVAVEPEPALEPELEPGSDTVETVLESLPPSPPVDEDALALELLTAPSSTAELPPEAPLEGEGDTLTSPPFPPELESEEAAGDAAAKVTLDESNDTIEVTPSRPPELVADEPVPVVPELPGDLPPALTDPPPVLPPVLMDEDDEPAPTLEVPMTFRSDSPPLALDVKPLAPAPPAGTPAPAPAASSSSAPALPAGDDRGKGKKKKNKQKPATIAPALAPPTPNPASAVAATAVVPAATAAVPAIAPAPAMVAPSVAPAPAAAVPAGVIPAPPAVPTPEPAVSHVVTAPPPPKAPVTVAKTAAPSRAPAARPVQNTAVIATPKLPSAPDARTSTPPANKPMSWGVVLIGGSAAVIGIAVLVLFATSNKPGTPKVQKAVSVAPAAAPSVAPPLAPAPGMEATTLAAQSGSMDVTVNIELDVGMPDAASATGGLTAMVLDAGADAGLDTPVADVSATDVASDVPDVTGADTTTEVADVTDVASAVPDGLDANSTDVASPALVDDVAAAAELASGQDVTAPDVVAIPDVPVLAAEDANVSTSAGSDAVVPTGGVDLRFIPPELLACPTGMAKLSKKMKYDVGGQKQDGFETYCIDRREYPGAGMPRTGVGLYAAKGACERKGGRLCTGAEWRRGCGGTYPYGSTFDESRCNTMTLDGTSREVAATGSFGRCRSGSGLADMVGNVAEWTADGMVRGGDAYKTGQDATCGFARRRAPDSGSPHVGFRCCAEPVLGDAPAEESP